MFTCTFTRANSNPTANYFNTNTQKGYLIAAFGQVDNSGS
jgi:hypothetical protein